MLNFSRDDKYVWGGQVLGKGAHGVVYKGKIMENSQPIAVKIIDMQKINCRDLVGRLKQECQILKSLSDDQFIVTLHDYYEEDNQLIMFLEFCQLDLGQFLNEYGIFQSADDAKVAFKQIAKGLSSLHSRNIIHRNIKPTNILIKTDQKSLNDLKNNRDVKEFLNKCQMKLTDFSVSIQLDNEQALAYTQTGTQSYQAPEVGSNQGYQLSSDIYSLGRVFRECLGYNLNQSFQSLLDLIDRMLQQDPQQRPTINEILKDLMGRYNSSIIFTPKKSIGRSHQFNSKIKILTEINEEQGNDLIIKNTTQNAQGNELNFSNSPSQQQKSQSIRFLQPNQSQSFQPISHEQQGSNVQPKGGAERKYGANNQRQKSKASCITLVLDDLQNQNNQDQSTIKNQGDRTEQPEFGSSIHQVQKQETIQKSLAQIQHEQSLDDESHEYSEQITILHKTSFQKQTEDKQKQQKSKIINIDRDHDPLDPASLQSQNQNQKDQSFHSQINPYDQSQTIAQVKCQDMQESGQLDQIQGYEQGQHISNLQQTSDQQHQIQPKAENVKEPYQFDLSAQSNIKDETQFENLGDQIQQPNFDSSIQQRKSSDSSYEMLGEQGSNQDQPNPQIDPQDISELDQKNQNQTISVQNQSFEVDTQKHSDTQQDFQQSQVYQQQDVSQGVQVQEVDHKNNEQQNEEIADHSLLSIEGPSIAQKIQSIIKVRKLQFKILNDMIVKRCLVLKPHQAFDNCVKDLVHLFDQVKSENILDKDLESEVKEFLDKLKIDQNKILREYEFREENVSQNELIFAKSSQRHRKQINHKQTSKAINQLNFMAQVSK